MRTLVAGGTGCRGKCICKALGLIIFTTGAKNPPVPAAEAAKANTWRTGARTLSYNRTF